KGETIANVGIGIVGTMSEEGKRAKDYLDKFIKSKPEFFANASMIEVNSGGIPVSVSSKTFVGDGIVVVGDAAQQVNPIHGGGIGLAMNAAKIAADVIANAIDEDNVSAKRLVEYEKIWQDTDGNKLKRLMKLRHFIETMDDESFEKLADMLSGDDILKLVVDTDLKLLLKVFIRKAPSMLTLAKKYLE
ncbi:MAG: NAD(P)/FAD-dependent oxidoreductase, partial [Candidatus Altiarchaeota archaeon]|nr:NAD(P)/FAD-dependent oxidoreductase [Candidatus Altiarchaeota archaeon]